MNAADIVTALSLVPHPEGGHYREIGRSTDRVARAALGDRHAGDRPLYTSIYYLLRDGEKSRFHRLRSDELWCLVSGGSLLLHRLERDGQLKTVRLGLALDRGEHPYAIVPRGTWFGAHLQAEALYALATCTVIPGFDFADFELGDRSSLLAAHPAHRKIIELLT